MRPSRLALLVGLALTTLLAGCDVGRESGILMAAGSYSDLAVVYSTPELAGATGRMVNEINEEVTFVIQAENRFNIDVYEPRQWKLARDYKNLLFLVVLGEGGPVADAVRKIVSDETLERLAAGSGGLVQIDDPFDTYQFAIVIASNDRNSLMSILHNNAERVRELIEERSIRRLQRRNRQTGLDSRLMNAYWRRYGFLLEIPKEFHENQVEPHGYPAVELMRNAPSRGITVAWTDHEDPEAALDDREFLLAFRRSMGEAVHNEEVAAAPQRWLRGQLGRNDAVKFEGAWTSTVFDGGGPFWCFFVADPAHGRVFAIDLLAYAPGMDKMVFFRQLEAVAATFSLERPQP